MGYAYGGTKTSVKKGAWRSKVYSENIMNCINPKHCEPDTVKHKAADKSGGNDLCTPGHVGPLC